MDSGNGRKSTSRRRSSNLTRANEKDVIAASERFQVGDSLGVVARNCPELVAAIVARLGVTPETPVTSPDGIERPLGEALSQACEIRRPSDQAIEGAVLAGPRPDCWRGREARLLLRRR
jgi:sulfite reductase alpha subunit-like flavoprotein